MRIKGFIRAARKAAGAEKARKKFVISFLTSAKKTPKKFAILFSAFLQDIKKAIAATKAAARKVLAKFTILSFIFLQESKKTPKKFAVFATLFCAFLCLNLGANADEGDINEYSHKMVIKRYTNDDFQMIDLQQVSIDTQPQKPLFDSSAELKRNDRYLEYKDSNKDFVLFAGYNEDLGAEFENLGVSLDEFLTNAFLLFIDEANFDKSVQLLNHQANTLYETPRNFEIMSRGGFEPFLISPLLNYETSFDRMYVKSPEFVLLVLLDEFYFGEKRVWFFTREFAFVNLRYKILRLKDNKIIQHKIYKLSFKMPYIKNTRERYEYVSTKIGAKLKRHFAEVVRGL